MRKRRSRMLKWNFQRREKFRESGKRQGKWKDLRVKKEEGESSHVVDVIEIGEKVRVVPKSGKKSIQERGRDLAGGSLKTVLEHPYEGTGCQKERPTHELLTGLWLLNLCSPGRCISRGRSTNWEKGMGKETFRKTIR